MTSATPPQSEGGRDTKKEAGDASLDGYERAIREGSRRYRPGKACQRPQRSERETGKPQRRQMDVFDDTLAGRAATRLARPAPERPATPEGAAGKYKGGTPPQGPGDARPVTQNEDGRANGKRGCAGAVVTTRDDRSEQRDRKRFSGRRKGLSRLETT